MIIRRVAGSVVGGGIPRRGMRCVAAQFSDHSLNLFTGGSRANECDDKLNVFIVSMAKHVKHVFQKTADVGEIVLGALCTCLAASVCVLVEHALALMCYAFRTWCWGATTLTRGQGTVRSEHLKVGFPVGIGVRAGEEGKGRGTLVRRF